MGMRTIDLIFGDPVPPEEVIEFVVSLGGDPPAPGAPLTGECELRRDGAVVLVDSYPPDRLDLDPRWAARYADALGRPARGRVLMSVGQSGGSEWLAAEVVLAAEERWGEFVIDDFAEMVITLPEFHTRLAERRADFFSAGYDPSPQALRAARTSPVTVLLPAEVVGEAAEGLLRSLGARMRPDVDSDAYLSRDPARLWVRFRAPGEMGTDFPSLSRSVLGEPPYAAMVLDVFDNTESQALAYDLIEATAARWPLLVHGPEGRMVTVDDIRLRVRQGAGHLF